MLLFVVQNIFLFIHNKLLLIKFLMQ